MTVNMNLGDTKAIVAECKKRGLPVNQTAYVLATAFHETAHSMKPVREMGGEKYLKSKPYYPYVGMGYAQITWLKNYEKASKKLGVDFVKNPKLLLQPKYAVPILVVGMVEGWFTGKKLSDYINASKTDFAGARRIINGTDKASLIAGYAKEYVAALNKQGYAKPAKAAPVHGIMAAIETPAEKMALSLGDKGPVVAELKKNLNALGYGPLTEDDLYDAATKTEVEAFQSGHKGEDGKALKVDGIAGLRTAKAIQTALLAPKIEEADKSVPAAATAEVKEKTGWLGKATAWITGASAVTVPAVASEAFQADWRTIVAIGGLVLAGGFVTGLVVLLLRRWLIAAFKDINEAVKQ